MQGYLGETLVNQEDSPYKDYTQTDWATHMIMLYGGIDGSHHKDWVLDQTVRLLKGTPMIISLAKWDNGHEEYRFRLGEATPEYHAWVADCCSGEDGPNTYDYEVGIAP